MITEALDAAVLDVLREVLTVQRESRDLLQQILLTLERQRPTRETRAAALLPILAASVAARAFSAREVMAHSTLVDSELRSALATAGIGNARQLGTWCRSIEGQVVGGLSLQRLGADRDGIVWRLWRV